MVAAISDADLVILVAEDSPYGLNDFQLAYQVVVEMNLQRIVIINKYEPNNSMVMKWCHENNIKIAGTIPFLDEIHYQYSKGDNIFEIDQVRECFKNIVSYITGRQE